MLRIAAYTELAEQRHLLCAHVDAAAKAIGSRSHGVRRLDSADDAMAYVKRHRIGLLDMLVCRIAPEGGNEFDTLRAIHQIDPSIVIVVIAQDADAAIAAHRAGATGFALADDGMEGLIRAMRPLVHGVMDRRRTTIGLRCDAGVGNVAADDIVFVEASRKGSIIHLVSGSTLLVRTPLRDLLAKLASKGAFLAVGSSFIMNLDNASKVGDGAAIFSNGESIVVPIRVRKSLKEAVDAFLFGAADAS